MLPEHLIDKGDPVVAIKWTRAMMAMMAGKGVLKDALIFAERWDDHDVVEIIKAGLMKQ